MLLASVYKIKSIKVQKLPIDIDGFPAWVSPNYESFPAKYVRHIENYKRPELKEIDSGCPFHDNYNVVIAGLPAKYRVELHNQGFIRVSSSYVYKNYVKNFKIDPSDIKTELDECINAIIEHAIGKPYNYRDHLFQTAENRTDDKVFYSLWISPDNGVIIVDHISMYDRPPTHSWMASYDVYRVPVRYMGPAVVFTNLVAYKQTAHDKDDVREMKASQAKFKFMNRIADICTGIEKRCYTTAIDCNTYNNGDIDRTGIMFDKNKHVYYSGASAYQWTTNNSQCIVHRTASQGQPAPQDIEPFKFPDKISVDIFTTYTSYKSNFKQVVNHPKIIGFINPENPYFIIYATPDRNFAMNLLGYESGRFLDEKCVMYYGYRPVVNGVKVNKYIKFYVFYWYTDAGMQLIDYAIKNNLSKTKIGSKSFTPEIQ